MADTSTNNEPVWVDSETGVEAMVAQLAGHAEVGYDSEFYGVDLATESCVGRAIVDVFSIAIPTTVMHPLGFHIPRSFVVEGKFLVHPLVRLYLEDPEVTKYIHNLSVDSHAARNAGVRIRGAVDTLNLARWVYPHRASLPSGNFDLDSLSRWRVGFGKTEEFDDLFGYWAEEPYEELVIKQRCLGCFELGCRKKKPPHDQKTPEEVLVTRHKRVRRHRNLFDVRPGHPDFERYRRYSAVDSELAYILGYLMVHEDGLRERYYPYGL